jgi:squalene synthase HpnC
MEVPVHLEITRDLPPLSASLGKSQEYTRALATTHYENFSVATYLLPRSLRQHFYNVYAYCRWSDDLADEVADTGLALELLDWWENELRECYAGTATHPVFIALRRTIDIFDIPMEPFSNLLTAFRQDQRVGRYPTWSSILRYCENSANPVGRLVLYLCGYRDSQRQSLSDLTCTALQLANFWQDVSRDLDKDRIYIPVEDFSSYGLSERDLFERRFDDRYANLMRGLIARTRTLFEQGLPLAEMVEPHLRIDIELFSRGGLAVLDAIESIGFNTLGRRPTISRATKLFLLTRALGQHAYRKFRR